MNEVPRAQRVGSWLIRAACRRLPPDGRAERSREWIAELPAILDDESIRWPFARVLRMLAFCAGISRTTRRLSRSARAGARRTRNAQWRTGGWPARPSGLAVRAIAGIAAGLVLVIGLITLITVLATGPHPDARPLLLVVPVAIGFDFYCITDIVRSPEVRYLRKWAWALICLAQTPLGGIVYLAVGRVGRARPMPPGAGRD